MDSYKNMSASYTTMHSSANKRGKCKNYFKESWIESRIDLLVKQDAIEWLIYTILWVYRWKADEFKQTML